MANRFDVRLILERPLIYRAFSHTISRSDAASLHAKENIRAVAGDRILDIGCGPGDILDSLPPVDYYGFDLNDAYIRFARRKYSGRGKFYCLAVENSFLPGEPHSFDIVIANGILHHLS